MYSSGFFDGEALYGQEEFCRYFNNLFESGVAIDDSGDMELAVTAGNGKVAVGAGFAIVRGFYFYNDSAASLPVAPDANYNRVDRVVLRLNALTGPVAPVIKEGTAGSNPAAPSLERNSTVYELSLAKITVTPSGEIIVADERADNSVCGAVRPKNLTEYKAMVAEFRRQWEAWFASQQAAGWRNIFLQEAEPAAGEAVTGSLWI